MTSFRIVEGLASFEVLVGHNCSKGSYSEGHICTLFVAEVAPSFGSSIGLPPNLQDNSARINLAQSLPSISATWKVSVSQSLWAYD